MIAGYASSEGSARYRDRHPSFRDAGHFRHAEHVPGLESLWCSSLGIGTYLGEADDASDALYSEAVRSALLGGVNLIDTAINYRHQRSERSIGAALKALIAEGTIRRDEIVVCSKAGYLAFEGEVPADPADYFFREYIETGVFRTEDVAGHMHCMCPTFLRNQLERSRANLRLETIDVYYVHNPEAQLGEVSAAEFRARLKSAFAELERAVTAGQIRFYGIASWNAFRVAASQQPFLSLEDCEHIAREAGGVQHHFRFVQLPFNLAMTEAYTQRTQPLGREHVCLFEAAERLGIAVVTSASLLQARLTHGLPQRLAGDIGLRTDAERALQFARSAPGALSALVGMRRPEHVQQNMLLASEKPMSVDAWVALFADCK